MAYHASDSDIAIIGTSCRVAGANSPSELWDLLASSRDVQSVITRFNTKGYYHPKGGPRKGLTNVKHAYMMDNEAIDKFDNAFFHTTPLEAIAMDPQQRMLLETAYETIENAGIPLDEFMGTDTAVYAGMDSCDYHLVLARDIDATPRYLATGTAACMAANRLSYFFDLSGPSLAVDTACSSTMAALHQAVRTLQCGEAKMALVCGAKLIINPDMFMPSSELGFLSPTGRCRSFDAAGDGYGRGEGALTVLLKPLKMALANRDPIRAVIKGTRLNQDGKTQGITLPSSEAQRRNMESLYQDLRISPNDIQYVEAHGTGTAAGDPLEFSAINTVFDPTRRTEQLVVGSVKSSIGHTESCAGLAAIIKTIECLERGMIPPQMHFNNPNPKINFHNVQIPIKLMDWPKHQGSIRRAAVNTFGAGGTNGHAVLESYPQSSRQFDEPARPLLYKVSASDTSAVRRLSLKYAAYVETQMPNLYDLAYTTLSRRSTLKETMFFTASTHEEVIQSLRAENPKTYTKAYAPIKGVAFLFTGQGAQSAQMGKALIEKSPLFKAVLVECEILLATLPDKPSWSIIEELSKAAKLSNVYQATFSQPLSTALQLGLIHLWKCWGLVPTAVVGHSSGEIAAAYAAGIISLRDAIIVAYYRGLYSGGIISSSASSRSKGAMCAISLSEKGAMEISEKFDGKIQLAAVNSRTSCTLSGDRAAIEEIVSICKQNGTFCRELRVDLAYHSHHMLSIGPQYEKALVEANVCLQESPLECDMFSSVTGQILTARECTPSYWKDNMLSTVRFSSAVSKCLKCNPDMSVVLEIGPHPTLKGPAQEILRSLGKDSVDYFNSCLRGKDDFDTLLESASAMIARGIPLNTPNINAREIVSGLQCTHEFGKVLTNLPSYCWSHSTRFWIESRMSLKLRYKQFPRHQLLGSRYLEDISSCPSWRNLLMLKEVPWLMELKTNGANVIPSSVFLLMALEATRQLQTSAMPDASSLLLSEIVFGDSLEFADFGNTESIVELHFHARPSSKSDMFNFEIFSSTTEYPDKSTLHCSGKLSFTNDVIESIGITSIAINHDQSLLDRYLSVEQTSTLALKEVRVSSRASSGVFDGSTENYENYFMDPAALDSILHLIPVSLYGRNLPAVHLISSIGSINVPVGTQNGSSGRFKTDFQSIASNGGQSNIELHVANSLVTFSKVCYEVDHLLVQKPALNSLYFKPVMLPDISKLQVSEPISLSTCLDMVTHKWPMSDIGIAAGNLKNNERILEALPGTKAGERLGFRSVQVLGEPVSSASDRVRFVEKFIDDSRFHLMFVNGDEFAKEIGISLHPCGLLCVRDLTDEFKLSPSYKKICKVTQFDQDDWSLWRNDDKIGEANSSSKTVIFACFTQSISSIQCITSSLCVPLQPTPVAGFCQQSKSEKFDAIVIDSVERPIITAWTGLELLPWLQTLLKWANSVLWVTQKVGLNPHSSIAGILLRTLQSEQPSLKVTWLVLEDTETETCKQNAIESAYNALLRGENEVRMEVKDSQMQILRYLPDDGLSATLGIVLPCIMSAPVVDKDYELSLAANQEPVILSFNPDPFKVVLNNAIRVAVEASIVDLDDLSMFRYGNKRLTRSGLGSFFAGRVVSGIDSVFPASSQVVGWHFGAHSNQVETFSNHLLLCEEKIPVDVAASTFAVLATALCIVDGHARARRSDTFRVQVGGVLGEAIKKSCKKIGATLLDSEVDDPPDFTVHLSPSGRILVNGSLVDVNKYLESDHGWMRITHAWKESAGFKSQVHRFILANHQQALRITPEEAYATVLMHSDVDKVKYSVPIYVKPATLFSTDGVYVIIGGLGGLGRWVCSWMIANGAKRLIIISRNGLQSEEAHEMFKAINTADTSLEVIKADACNRTAMADLLAQIRRGGFIRGVINMAMLLGDAPLEAMEGWQWDRALRLKVDSSWILHEETLNDPLEFFILFSSIASVLGNRNQAGYNAGNMFLNALAEYRQSRGLTAISIALGAMTEIGILHELGREDLLQNLSRSGLSHLGKSHLAKIMEAAVLESHRSERWLILTGLEMFERVDGKLVGVQGQTQLYWTEVPEFSHLQSHRLSDAGGGNSDAKLSLREKISKLPEKEKIYATILAAFLDFLSQLLGFDTSTLNPTSPLSTYGLDSLSAVSCQYWFFRELSVDVSVSDVLNSTSINQLIALAASKLVPGLG